MESILSNLLGKINSFTSGIRLRNDDDFLDRLNHRYTTIILLIFTAVVTTKQYVGNPIHCWCPAEYKSTPYYEYINQVCWVSNTYYISMDDTIPLNAGLRKDRELQYYQWVPMILLLMALLFKIPRMLWKVLASSASFKLDKFITLVQGSQLTSENERKEKLEDLVNYIHEWRETSKPYRSLGFKVKVRRRIHKNYFMWCGNRHGNYFLMSAVLVKVMYLVNVCMQFTLLNDFLGTNYELFGFEIMDGLANGKHDNLKASPRFPFVTLCDFKLRHLQNVQNWTIQCVLPINLFNEKIFICVWFWLAVVCTLSLINLFANSMVFPARRLRYIKKFLKLRHIYSSSTEEKRTLYKFVHSYLNFDGVFVIRIAAHNGTDILVANLVEKLYLKFKDTFGQTRQPNGELVTVKYQEE